MSGAEAAPAVDGTAYILVAIVLVGIALGAAIIPGLRQLRRDVNDMGQRIGKLEGKMEVLSSATMQPETIRDDQDD